MSEIKIDYSRDGLFDELGIKRLKESYMTTEEKSPQERFAYVSKIFGSNSDHAQRLYDYSSRHWLSYSTPVLSYNDSGRGLPVSCYLNYIEDTAEGLVENLSETNWLSMMGGGVGIGFGIRSADDKSTGVMAHLKIYDASSLAYRQGRTRRGSYAAYLNINHPDIISFLDMRKPTGDLNVRCQNMHHGINITDDFMQIIENCMIDPEVDDKWNLVDPHSKEIRETVSAKALWQSILEMRMLTGEPYIHFISESNRKLPKWLSDRGLRVHQSNLCLTGDTLVNVIIDNDQRSISLEEVISLFSAGKEIKVESKNLNRGIAEYSQITNAAMTARNSHLILIEDEESGKSIRCTPEHKIYTKNRGYVMAKDLTENDSLDIL